MKNSKRQHTQIECEWEWESECQPLNFSPKSVETEPAKSKKPGQNEAKAVQKLRVWVTAAFSRFISGLSNLEAQWEHTHTKKCPKNQTKFGSKKQLRYLFVFSKPGTYHPPRRLKGGGAPLDNIWGCPANILHRNILRQWASILYT